MAKLLKIIGRTLGIILEWLLVFLIVFAFAIRTSPVQTFLAQQATNYLSKELNTKVKIDKVDIVFFDQVALDGFLILDQKKDTLLSVKTLFATLDDYNFSKLNFTVGKVRLKEAFGQLTRDKQGKSNLQFIIDHFKSDKPSSGKQLSLAIHTVELSNSRFKYDDESKVAKDFGVDFTHLDVSKVNGYFEAISIVGGDVKAKIVNFNAKEKSGLELKNITTQASVGNNGIYLMDAKVAVNDSKINAPKLNLIYSGFDDFSHFVDSVKFDAQLNLSNVSMKDVSRFAPQLRGMDEMVSVKGDVHDVVNKLKINNLDFRIRNKTHLIAKKIELPNFAKLDASFVHQNLHYAYVDLNEIQKVKLPNSSSTRYLKLDKYTNRLGYFEAEDVKLDVFGSQFVVASDIVRTKLGAARLDNGIQFEQKEHSLTFTHSQNSTYDFKVEQFDLGAFLQNGDLGIVDGTFFVEGEAFSTSNIDFTKIEGEVNQFDFLGYSYAGIDIERGEFKDNRFDGEITVNDKYAGLKYDGFIDFNGIYTFDFTANVTDAILDKLKLTEESTKLNAEFIINLSGTTADNISGTIKATDFHYEEGGRDLHVPELLLSIERAAKGTEVYDKFTLNSNVANASIEGVVNFDHLIGNLDYQLSRVLPALFKTSTQEDLTHTKDHFEFNLNVKDPDDFLAIFIPDLKISSGTEVIGHYYGESSNFLMSLHSDSVKYDKYKFDVINISQVLDSNSVVATCQIEEFTYNDSLKFHDLFFKTSGGDDQLFSDLIWDNGTPYASHIRWQTEVRDKEHYNFLLDPSYFSLNDNKWEIAKQAKIDIDRDTISIDGLKIEQGKQFISLDGQISNLDEHKLKYTLNSIDLSQLDEFIGNEIHLQGKLNSWGDVSNPFNNLMFNGDAHIMQFEINDNEIGDVFAHSEWDQATESIQMNGDLMYKGFRTFDFDGSYFTKKEKDNLAFNLVFDKTDISFTNAFMDPDVVTDIRGTLNGKLAIKGTPEKPALEGEVNLDKANANVKLLGAHFGVEGAIVVDESGFYINDIPIFDEEGNTGSLVGSVYHENFENFNFDLLVNLETEGIGKNPLKPWIRNPLDRFLVMNSTYTPEAIYYGKAYATGVANIYGYANNLEITVDLKTQKGTDIKFPMYGAGQIDEEYDFITFIQDSVANGQNRERKIDFTGVDLDLHFDVTENANLEIIFDEEIGDIIRAKGVGDITIKLDNLGDIRMDGAYTISEGVYDFTMGVIKQPFIIEKGGNIAWTGNPYDAQLDLKTYKTVSANIAALSSDQFSGGGNAHEDIRCYLILTESLLKPAISFDIQAPKANETGKALIDRVRKDKDELNRQFFSLMLAKTFQPLGGQTSASGGAAMDLLENQINGLLAKVSSDYQLNLNLDNDNFTGDNTVEFGLKKGFLDDRLILSGSFGVESEADNNSSIIGEVNLEYKLNESGTFRVNIFNESNNKTIIADQQKGNFTQGAGVHYQEDFNGADDFKAFQTFLDIFRKKENKRNTDKRKKRQVAVPPKEGDVVPTNDD